MLTFVLLAYIWNGAAYDALELDYNLTGADCIARLEDVAPDFTRNTILACELDRGN